MFDQFDQRPLASGNRTHWAVPSTEGKIFWSYWLLKHWITVYYNLDIRYDIFFFKEKSLSRCINYFCWHRQRRKGSILGIMFEKCGLKSASVSKTKSWKEYRKEGSRKFPRFYYQLLAIQWWTRWGYWLAFASF